MVVSHKRQNRIREPFVDRVFNVLLFLFVLALLVVFAYPLYFVLVASFSNPGIVGTGAVLLYPRGMTLVGYQNILKNARIWIGYRNTIFYVTGGTLTALCATIPAAYALSR
ncbi:MAG TPA: carbohydrate ABC transporter permease, partial [Clostridia bacterium]|nr:carbohydrate ABC transporter permease [Clostridia bacterium]